MTLKVLALGGDGIGPEVVGAALQVLEVAAAELGQSLDISEDLLHGAAWEQYGTFIKPETLTKAQESDALLVGATGGPQWDHIVIDGALTEGYATRDLGSEHTTQQIADAVIRQFRCL